MKNKKQARFALMLIQAFNGLSGLAGGIMLTVDPTGSLLQMPLELLKGTPFSNFLIPGIVLFLFVGLSNTIGFFMTRGKHQGSSSFGLFFGAVLMIWIITQVVMIGYASFLQPLYFLTGLVQVVLAYRIAPWQIKY